MITTISEVLSTITQSSGLFSFHIILAFTIAGSLSSSWFFNHTYETNTPRRIISGLTVLLGIRSLYFLFLLFTNPTQQFPPLLAGSIDRGIGILGLFIFIWLWGFPNPTRQTNTWLMFLAALSIGGGLIASFLLQLEPALAVFNGSASDNLWSVIHLTTIGVAVFFFIRGKQPHWKSGTLVLTIAALGVLGEFIFPVRDSNFSGTIYVSQLIYYPFLFLLPRWVVQFFLNQSTNSEGIHDLTQNLESTKQQIEMKQTQAMTDQDHGQPGESIRALNKKITRLEEERDNYLVQLQQISDQSAKMADKELKADFRILLEEIAYMRQKDED